MWNNVKRKAKHQAREKWKNTRVVDEHQLCERQALKLELNWLPLVVTEREREREQMRTIVTKCSTKEPKNTVLFIFRV